MSTSEQQSMRSDASQTGTVPLRASAALIIAAEQNPVEILKDDPARSILRHVAVNGEHFVVKRYRVPTWKTRLLHPLRQSPIWREWRGAKRLQRAGRRVSMPLAMWCDYARGREAQVLLFPYVEGTALHHLVETAPPPPPEQWPPDYRQKRLRLARIVGRQLGELLAAGIVNRDHKLSNLIMDNACEQEGAEPVMIDPLGLRRRKSDEQVMRMLGTLLRTTQRAGYVSLRECLRCLKALLDVDATLARGERRRLKYVAGRAAFYAAAKR